MVPNLTFVGSLTALTLLLVTSTVVGAPPRLTVGFGEKTGTIRPLHGVNGGCVTEGEMVDLIEHWRAVKIPITRLHDVNWPRPDVLDFHAIFPSLDADPSKPESYSFQKTDDYAVGKRLPPQHSVLGNLE